MVGGGGRPSPDYAIGALPPGGTIVDPAGAASCGASCENRTMRGRGLFLLSSVVACMVAASSMSTAAAATKLQRPLAAPKATPAVSVPAPGMADLVLDEAHQLLYGSDIVGNQVWVFSLPTLGVVTTIPTGPQSHPYRMAVSTDGSMLAVVRSGIGDIALVDTATGIVTAALVPSTGSPLAVGFGRPGRLYSTGHGSGGLGDDVHVWDVAGHTEVGHSACCTNYAPDLAVTADGNTLYAAESDIQFNTEIRRFDIRTDTPTAAGVTPPVLPGESAALDVKPDGSRVYSAGGEVWSADLQTLLGRLPVSALDVAYAAGGDLAILGGSVGGLTDTLTRASASASH